MYQSERGIVLDTFKYKESSLICRMFTEHHGLLSVIVTGTRAKHGKNHSVYFQPLTLIDCQLYLKEKAGLVSLKEVSLISSSVGLLPNSVKYAVAIFIAEFVLKTTQERDANREIFDLLSRCNYIMCHQESELQDLHLFFLVVYAVLQGVPLTSQSIHQTEEECIVQIISDKLPAGMEYASLGLNGKQRAKVLQTIITQCEVYYGGLSIKSLKVLEQVFS
jgi:DNA repair protein RecO (recombination protein O)